MVVYPLITGTANPSTGDGFNPMIFLYEWGDERITIT